MSKIQIEKSIDAPPDLVFKTVADIREFSKAVPYIMEVEFLTAQKSGVGTTFRETREMNGREVSNELEITEYQENDRVRLVSENGGTKWDSLFTVSSQNGKTKLSLIMEAQPYKWWARLMNLLMKGMIRKVIAKDLNAVKMHCETKAKRIDKE